MPIDAGRPAGRIDFGSDDPLGAGWWAPAYEATASESASTGISTGHRRVGWSLVRWNGALLLGEAVGNVTAFVAQWTKTGGTPPRAWDQRDVREVLPDTRYSLELVRAMSAMVLHYGANRDITAERERRTRLLEGVLIEVQARRVGWHTLVMTLWCRGAAQRHDLRNDLYTGPMLLSNGITSVADYRIPDGAITPPWGIELPRPRGWIVSPLRAARGAPQQEPDASVGL